MKKQFVRESLNKRSVAAGAVLSVLFGAAMVFGAQLEQRGGIAYEAVGTWLRVLGVSVPAFAGILGLSMLLFFLERRRGEDAAAAAEGRREERPFYRAKGFYLTALVFLLCWLPVFLAAFPGFFLYDAQEELNMVLTRRFTTHHPLLHVLMLGGTVKAVEKLTGSYNAGIAVYLCCQAAFAAMSFSYILYRMKSWGISRPVRAAGGVYLALFPVIAMFALCSTKDVPFTVCLLLFLVTLVELPGRLREMSFLRAAWPPVLWGVLMMLLRHNGVYALAAAVPFYLFAAGKNRKKLAVVLAAAVILYIGCSGALKAATRADDSENQEILTVPIQQLARVHAYERDAFDEKDLETLYSFLPKEALGHYRPDNSDLVKIRFQNAFYEEHGAQFYRLWLGTGLKKPATYLNAFFANNYGYWYPYTVLNCYSGNQMYTFVYRDSSYFGFETEQPGVRKSLLPAVEEWIRKISLEISWQRIPGLRVLFHPAYYFWTFLFALYYQFTRKRYRVCCGGMLILALVATVLLGPQVTVRYVLSFYFGFPLLLALLLEAAPIERRLCIEG